MVGLSFVLGVSFDAPSTSSSLRRTRLIAETAQMGLAGASMLLGLEGSLLPDNPPSVGDLFVSSLSSLVASAHAWTLAAALATYLVCLVSDLRLGSTRSAYKARCVVVKESPRAGRTRTRDVRLQETRDTSESKFVVRRGFVPPFDFHDPFL